MKKLAMLAGLLLLVAGAAEKKPQPLPFTVVNCAPRGDGCQALTWPREHAAYLYYEVLAAFEIRGHKVEPVNPWLMLGDPDVVGPTCVSWSLQQREGKVFRTMVSLKEWNDLCFATGLAYAINKELAPALTDKELAELVLQAVVSAKAKVSVDQLKQGK